MPLKHNKTVRDLYRATPDVTQDHSFNDCANQLLFRIWKAMGTDHTEQPECMKRGGICL